MLGRNLWERQSRRFRNGLTDSGYPQWAAQKQSFRQSCGRGPCVDPLRQPSDADAATNRLGRKQRGRCHTIPCGSRKSPYRSRNSGRQQDWSKRIRLHPPDCELQRLRSGSSSVPQLAFSSSAQAITHECHPATGSLCRSFAKRAESFKCAYQSRATRRPASWVAPRSSY